jgi:hypothetical protein
MGERISVGCNSMFWFPVLILVVVVWNFSDLLGSCAHHVWTVSISQTATMTTKGFIN